MLPSPPSDDPQSPAFDRRAAGRNAIEAAAVAAQQPLPVNSINFGPLTIEWPKIGVRTPLGWPIEPELLEQEVSAVSLCPITYRLAGIGEFTVPADEVSDLASIPRPAWGIRRFSPGGKKIWGAFGHDRLCKLANLGEIDRVMADAWFDAILEHTGVGAEERTILEIAVNGYRWFCRYLKWRAGQ